MAVYANEVSRGDSPHIHSFVCVSNGDWERPPFMFFMDSPLFLFAFPRYHARIFRVPPYALFSFVFLYFPFFLFAFPQYHARIFSVTPGPLFSSCFWILPFFSLPFLRTTLGFLGLRGHLRALGPPLSSWGRLGPS